MHLNSLNSPVLWKLGRVLKQHALLKFRNISPSQTTMLNHTLLLFLHRHVLFCLLFSLLSPSSQPLIDRVSSNLAQSSSRSQCFCIGEVADRATNTQAVRQDRPCRRRFDPHSPFCLILKNSKKKIVFLS